MKTIYENDSASSVEVLPRCLRADVTFRLFSLLKCAAPQVRAAAGGTESLLMRRRAQPLPPFPTAPPTAPPTVAAPSARNVTGAPLQPVTLLLAVRSSVPPSVSVL